MSKFSNKYIRIRPTAPVTAGPGRALTHEGAVGYAPDLESELFLMAATYMATEPTFYETAEAREARFVDLVHRVTASNPEFVARLAPYLRKDLKIRSASICWQPNTLLLVEKVAEPWSEASCSAVTNQPKWLATGTAATDVP